MICYRKATLDDLNRIWDYNIAQNPDEPRNQRWRDSYISRNVRNTAATYVILVNDEPVGEVTVDYFAEAHGNPQSRHLLADGTATAYLTALRIRSEFEGHGLISSLMRYVEASAAQMGFSRLTIGVEAAESRNLAIYLHWGYDQFLFHETEEDALILFYAKSLNNA